MARKWVDAISCLHTILSLRRGPRFLIALLLGSAITLSGLLPFAQSAPAQLSPYASFERGQSQYEAGQYAEAVESLTAAITQFESQNQSLQQAIALSNLGLTYQALRQWDAAEAAILQALDLVEWPRDPLDTMPPPELSPAALAIVAGAFNIYGKGLLQSGDAAEALAVWQQASQLYRNLQNAQGRIASDINQLQALQSLGLFQQASILGQQLRGKIEAQANPVTQIKGLLNLGNVERAIGHLDKAPQNADSDESSGALATLLDALEIAQTVDEPKLVSDVHLSLGTTYQALGDRETERQVAINRQGLSPWVCLSTATQASAKPYYQLALSQYQAAATHPLNQVAAGLNQLRVLKALNQWDDDTTDVWQQLKQQVEAMSPSRNQVYGQIALAKQGACLNQLRAAAAVSWEDIQSVLMSAVAIAQTLDDTAAESYARGNLGGLYEYFSALEASAPIKKNADVALTWRDAAKELTQQALLLAQPTEFPEIAFQWQWQLARLANAEAKSKDAIDYYKQAVNTLETARGNLLTVDSDVQFSFRDNVEPVYRELVDLLLQPNQPSQDDLAEAIRYIDTLQLSELENFLQCSLATVELTETVVDNSAANLYGIVLKDRVEVILSLPDQDLQRVRHFIAQTDLEASLETLQDNLRSPAGTNRAKNISAELYDWVIRPFESVLDAETELERSDVKVLTFVSDTSLRSIPMGVLYDRQRDRYLLERYAIATVPSLRVVEPEPLSRQFSVFAGGTSEELKHPFRDITLPPLEQVKAELAAIQAVFPTGDYSLLNDAFTADNVERTLERNSYPVVHIATHGEFSADPERTFILLSDKHLDAREIDGLLRMGSRQDGIKMLVLSACKTATGDKRATLGLAGLTVRAGSRSTLATLWQVDDASTAAVMQEFYQTLKNYPEISKVEALRRSQLALWNNPNWRSPLHWAPYVMVGNWQ